MPSAPRRPHRTLARGIALLVGVALVATPVSAQQELRDAETEAFLADLSAPLASAAGLKPGNLKVILLQSDEINAFVAGGQTVYIHSATIAAADDANELQGVIAHEIGHIVGGHVPLGGENVRGANSISILSLIAGVAAIAAGAGEAGMAALMAGQTAAMGKYLAFSRAQESSADASAIRTLRAAHLSGEGMLRFFGKLRNEEYRLSPSEGDIDPYMQTHPMSAERQRTLTGDVKASPYDGARTDPALQARFLRVKAKLIGYLDDPTTTFRKYPTGDQSVPAIYARTFAWHKSAFPDRSVGEVDKLLAKDPHDPYYLEIKGQVYLESGEPKKAIAPLREAAATTNAPLIASLFGHALLATEDPANFAEAKKVLRVAVQRDDENPFAWYQLGAIYAQEGDMARAALASAEQFSLQGNPKNAKANAEVALRSLPANSPDWLRADDIARAAEVAMDRKKK